MGCLALPSAHRHMVPSQIEPKKGILAGAYRHDNGCKLFFIFLYYFYTKLFHLFYLFLFPGFAVAVKWVFSSGRDTISLCRASLRCKPSC